MDRRVRGRTHSLPRVICAIGPQNAFLLQQGATGNRPALFAGASAAADVSLMSVGAFGFGAALLSAPAFGLMLSGVGAAFLAYYGAMSLIDSAHGANGGGATSTAAKAGLAAWAAITLLNPVYYVDNLVVIGGTAAALDDLRRASFLAGSSAGAVIWFFGLVFLSERMAPLLSGRGGRRLIAAASGAFMIWTSVRIVMTAFDG